MIAKATASSTSEKPLFQTIAPNSGRNDHDPVVDRGRNARPVFEDQVCGRGILSFEVVRRVSGRTGLAVKRATGKHQDRLLVIRLAWKVVYSQAGGRGRHRRIAGGGVSGRDAAGSIAGGHRIIGLAVPLVLKEPGDIGAGWECVGKARKITRKRRERDGDRRLVIHVASILQPSGIGEGAPSHLRHERQCWLERTDAAPIAVRHRVVSGWRAAGSVEHRKTPWGSGGR